MIDKTKKYHVGEKEKKKNYPGIIGIWELSKKKNFFFHPISWKEGGGGGKNKYTILKDDS